MVPQHELRASSWPVRNIQPTRLRRGSHVQGQFPLKLPQNRERCALSKPSLVLMYEMSFAEDGLCVSDDTSF